jgi:hypothetical protein
MFDLHLVLDKILDVVYGTDIRYCVTVNGTVTHYSRSYRKASIAYETETQFAKLFKTVTNLSLVRTKCKRKEYLKVRTIGGGDV